MRYFTSDLHLFHSLVYKKYRSNFSSIEDMHTDLVSRWNRQVKAKDIVYILGDVTFGKLEETKEIISKLNGRKILIRGNHDERFTSAQWIQLGFEDVRDVLVLKKSLETNKPAQKWILCHYPYSSPLRYFFYKIFGPYLGRRSEASYYKLYLAYKGYKLVHGHHHDGPIYKHDQVNVAWDVHKRLLSENEVREIFLSNETTGIKRVWRSIVTALW